VKAWQAVDEHVATLNKIGGLVGQFGPTSSSLPLIERPAELYSASVDDRSLMLTEFELGRASFIFRSTNGLHRKSPWFSPHPCSINTIAESRERMRAFAEDARQDRVFEETLFWVVTRTLNCFY